MADLTDLGDLFARAANQVAQQIADEIPREGNQDAQIGVGLTGRTVGAFGDAGPAPLSGNRSAEDVGHDMAIKAAQLGVAPFKEH